MAFLSRLEVKRIGFKSIGENVLISDKSSIYNPSRISIGSNVRVDDFCVLSAGVGGINIGNYVHVAAFSSLLGAGNISLENFSNISSRVSIYSSNDDYSGSSLTNPMTPEKFKNVEVSDVFIGKHVIIGSGSVILPGVSLNDGVAVGALSLINKDCEAYWIYAGAPARKLKRRKKDMLRLERIMLSNS